jgi:hypothetical protein
MLGSGQAKSWLIANKTIENVIVTLLIYNGSKTELKVGWWNKNERRNNAVTVIQKRNWRGRELVDAEIIDRSGPISQLPEPRLRRGNSDGHYIYR